MTDNQNQAQHNEQDPPRKFITLEEAEESIKRCMDLNDELFRRMANDDRFDQVVKEVARKYARTLKRLADGDSGKNPN